jgi:hypothetical protein
MMVMMMVMMIHFMFINVPSQQPDGKLQKLHNVQTQVTQNNKQDTNETQKTK